LGVLINLLAVAGVLQVIHRKVTKQQKLAKKGVLACPLLLKDRPHMDKRLCSILGCNRVLKAKGYCSMHHQRWFRYGDPLYTRAVFPCKAPGCNIKLTKEGIYCKYHYNRKAKTGDPLNPVRVPKKCLVDGCTEAHRARNMCRVHYRIWYKNKGAFRDSLLPPALDLSSSGDTFPSNFQKFQINEQRTE
jgi:hypothetical protein